MNNSYCPQLKRALRCLMTLTACLLLSGCASLSSRSSNKPFSIVVLPDTQLYSLRHPEIFVGQTQWIAAQKNELNIVCVIHEGDITHNNTPTEWANADRAMRILDGVVPYCMVMGNHDYGPGKPLQRNSADQFNKHFGSLRFEKEPWYGGHFADGNQNAYYTIHAGGMDFLIVCLEFGPRDEVIEWANRLVSQYRDYRIIVVTHAHTNWDDTRIGPGDKYNPHDYGCDNDGEDLWDKFLKKHENIFMVLSGHILNDGLGRLTSVGDHGNKVHQILANYQMKTNGGNGWLRIMKFLPAEHRIQISTYSPTLKQYATDAQNQFEIEY